MKYIIVFDDESAVGIFGSIESATTYGNLFFNDEFWHVVQLQDSYAYARKRGAV